MLTLCSRVRPVSQSHSVVGITDGYPQGRRLDGPGGSLRPGLGIGHDAGALVKRDASPAINITLKMTTQRPHPTTVWHPRVLPPGCNMMSDASIRLCILVQEQV